MNTSFNKMIHFTRLIKVNGRLREFNFRKNNTAGSNVYDVDTADDRGNRIFFKLFKEDNEWGLISTKDLPGWITENDKQLVTELEEGLVNN